MVNSEDKCLSVISLFMKNLSLVLKKIDFDPNTDCGFFCICFCYLYLSYSKSSCNCLNTSINQTC